MSTPTGRKVAILTHWAALSSFYEFSFNVVEELVKQGCETFILATEFTAINPKLPQHEDGKNVLRLNVNLTTDDVLLQLANWGIDILLVHSECAKNPDWLNHTVRQFTKTRAAYLFIHSEVFNKTIDYTVYTALLYPSNVFAKLPPGSNIKIAYMDQGVLEYPFNLVKHDDELRQELRRQLQLPVANPKEGDFAGYLLTTFDGKTNILDVVSALEYINEYKLVDQPIYLYVQVANPSRFDYFQQLANDHPCLLVSLGYDTPNDVTVMFNAADASIFVYPETRERYTSSAIRFAVGARSAILTNNANHVADLREAVSMWIPGTSRENIKTAVVNFFQNFRIKYDSAQRTHARLVEARGWSKQVKNFLTNIVKRP